MPNVIRIGTRGSRLALIQTELVAAALKSKDPTLEAKIVIITTTGDTNQSPIPLDTVGKSWFTREIDEALLSKKIDLAVHSLKDLPLTEAPGLSMHIVLSRADPRDCIVSTGNITLLNLPENAVVGTDSSRRRALLLKIRPDLTVKSIRGNVQTRLRKLKSGDYDAIVLAAAGLERLGDSRLISEYLDPTSFIPASGQAALATTARSSDHQLIKRLTEIVDPSTLTATLAERTFSARFGGGCQLPVAAHARITGADIEIHGVIAEINGPGILQNSGSGPAKEWLKVAETLADGMRDRCPFELTYEHA